MMTLSILRRTAVSSASVHVNSSVDRSLALVSLSIFFCQHMHDIPLRDYVQTWVPFSIEERLGSDWIPVEAILRKEMEGKKF